MPGRDRLPSTLQRSPGKAQRTWAKAHDSAVHTYGEGARAHRVAFAALKHGFEKVGDHWEAKAHPGPSDPHAAQGGPHPRGRTAGGVDLLGHSKQELYERARALGIAGRSAMSKEALARAIARRQR